MPIRQRFQAQRHVLTLFLAITLVPAAALGWLGWRILTQDRAFKGTARRPYLWKEIRDHGCSDNATDSDRTNYFETCAATEENLRWALEMEADCMVNSRVAPQDFSSEMTVVRNELEASR